MFFSSNYVLYGCILGCVCNNLFRDIIPEHMMDKSQGCMIGGPDCTVKVDESLFGWLNHNLVQLFALQPRHCQHRQILHTIES